MNQFNSEHISQELSLSYRQNAFDNFFDSPLWPKLSHKFEECEQADIEEKIKVQCEYANNIQSNTEMPVKLYKQKKIRTNRNSQKTYHLLLKHWLFENQCQSILHKYEQYFNKRVYFVLVLDEITKHVDGETFTQAYKELVTNTIFKKQQEIQRLNGCKQGSEQVAHLRRLISEIQYSLIACRAFMEGKTLESLKIVYCRDQKRLTKIKDFEKALLLFKQMTGHEAQDM